MVQVDARNDTGAINLTLIKISHTAEMGKLKMNYRKDLQVKLRTRLIANTERDTCSWPPRADQKKEDAKTAERIEMEKN